MKQGSFKALSFTISLILLAGMPVFSAFGDESVVSLESIVIETFSRDSLDATHWYYGPSTRWYSGSAEHEMGNDHFQWDVRASRFTTQYADNIFPDMAYVPSWPIALHGIRRNQDAVLSLGVRGAFDRRGHNWVDIFPTQDAEPFEIPLPGRVAEIDMWVWGSNLNYELEAVFRDHQGMIHTVPMGNLAYTGWRNLSVKIPSNIPQGRRIQPTMAPLRFVKFRVWTAPLERVDDFYIYFNNFKVLTDNFVNFFDGDDLANPDWVRSIWNNTNGEAP